MASKYMPRTREFRGIQPASCAIIAKNPSSKPGDWLTLKNRAYDDSIKQLESQVREQKKQDLIADFETNTEKRIMVSNIKMKVKNMAYATQYDLEMRRQKLRELLAQEEACLIKEMEDKEETVLERQAKMRERAKFLKDKRESERLVVVQDKYDQQFRAQCEELRSTLSKRHQDTVCLERLEQLRQKDAIAAEKKAQEQMYARLWEQDMMEKAAREEREAKDLHERNRGVLEILRKQMAALQAQKQEAKQLKEEEAQLLKEQRAIWKIEDEKARMEKARKQQATRDMLDRSLASKARKKAKEEQETLAFDLKMLEQLLEESRNEAMETMQRKRELREEDRRYRDYLTQLHAEEKAREAELEKMIQLEVAAAWEKRIDQWRRERQARKLMMNDVMEGRARQLQERLLQNELRQKEAAREREELSRRIEENQRLDSQEAQANLMGRLQYQQDLVDQMAYNSQAREAQARLEDQEFMLAQQAEREYQCRMKEVLDDPGVEKLHPMRRKMMSAVKNC